MINWNCDGAGPHTAGEVRRYPLGGGTNLILCRACVGKENRYRAERRNDTAAPIDPANFPLQSWESLKRYGSE